ncbi:MAG: DUF2938 domain-containing protein [Gemmatimonadales bacterium]
MDLAPVHVAMAILVGLGATLVIDLWALLLRRGFNIPSLSMCLLGRWLLQVPKGTFMHRSIAQTPPGSRECTIGWIAHYLIGATFALIFAVLTSGSWLERPTIMPALIFGVVTTLVPLFVMQPALGLGVAASQTPHPNQARVKSLATHTIFGLGLYLWASLLSHFVFPA